MTALNPQTAFLALRELGLQPLWWYARYRLGLWSGAHRRSTPLTSWDDPPLEHWLLPGVPYDPAGYAAFRKQHRTPIAFKKGTLGSDRSVAQADGILKGVFPAFGGLLHARGLPPDWDAFLSPAPAAARCDTRAHWSKVHLDGLAADVKLVWELSRFGWVYPLGRAYAHTGDSQYAAACLRLIDCWMLANPPNRGVHWASAQEVGFRLLAVAYSLEAFVAWFEENPEQLLPIARLVAFHAARIPPTWSYARAQDNNHLLIEAAALLTAGMLFSELRPAARWETLGRRWLERGLQTQFFPDGGYVQFSSNYHRLALEAGLWAACLCGRMGKPLSAGSLDALRRGALGLQALVDPATGQASNFGPNDGAHLLRLTDCGEADYRPALQLARKALWGEPLYPPGPWDEAASWLGVEGAAAVRSGSRRARPKLGHRSASTEHIQPVERKFPDCGLYRIDGQHSWALLRCARFKTRPGHSDQLHTDLWWRGTALATDAGTYLYQAARPWDNALCGAASHNSVVLDKQDPMLRAGRFLWLSWAQARLLGHWQSPGGEAELLSAEHDGYRSIGVTHRRSVLHLAPDLWWVVDDLLGHGEHELCLTWRLADGPWQLDERGVSLATNIGRVAVLFDAPVETLAIYRAGRRLAGEGVDDPIRGWVSPTYSLLKPSVELVINARGRLPLRLITRFELGEARPAGTNVIWRQGGEAPPLRSLRRGGFRWEL